jgi:23S rRNA pseudouridine1911/1915/1917 synthase
MSGGSDALQAVSDAVTIAAHASRVVSFTGRFLESMSQIIANPEDRAASAPPELIELSTPAQPGERLDHYLARLLPQFSRTRLQRWIEWGAIRWDERVLDRRHRLSGIERITVEPQPIEADQAFGPEPVDFTVHDEDPSVLIVDKRAGLVVHPGAGNWQGTLLNGLLHRFPRQAGLPRAGIVHRLDRDTSGLMVVARTERAMASLGAQLADRSMGRRYLAVVSGRAPESGEIDAAIARDPGNRLRFAVPRDDTSGRPAQTDFRLLASGAIDRRPISVLECRLHTGRTHQIRVHMRHLGLPIVGDILYGGPTDPNCSRQALHAWRLRLNHPESGREQAWSVRPPADISALIQAAGIDLEDCLERAAGGEGWADVD